MSYRPPNIDQKQSVVLVVFAMLLLGLLATVVFGILSKSSTSLDAADQMVSLPSKREIDPFVTSSSYPDINRLKGVEGSDIRKMVSTLLFELDIKRFSKSEYETQEDFYIRFQDDTNRLMIEGGLNHLRDNFVLFTNKPGLWDIGYDPEKKTMYLNYSINERINPVIEIDSIQTEYYGQNAFGVQKKIKKRESTLYRLDVVNADSIKTKKHKIDGHRDVDVVISMDPVMAERFLGKGFSRGKNLRFLYITKLSAPYYRQKGYGSERVEKATLDHPYEQILKTETIYTELIGFVAYDISNGEVILHKRFVE